MKEMGDADIRDLIDGLRDEIRAISQLIDRLDCRMDRMDASLREAFNQIQDLERTTR